jgi:hypothetical protein
LEASSFITFNTNIAHLRDVLCSSQEYCGRMDKGQLTRSGRG